MQRTTTTLPLAPAATGGFPALRQLVRSWRLRAKARRDLSRLDAHMLRDIGLDARSAESEAARPFWQD